MFMYEINPLVPSKRLERFGTMLKAFDQEEVERILFYEKILTFEPGATGYDNKNYNSAVRNCEVSFLPVDQNTRWLWDKIAHLTGIANYDLFLYDITAIQSLQFTRYMGNNDPDNGGHYSWHIDPAVIDYRKFDRKISGILMLSDRNDYVGGNFEIDIHGNFRPEILNLDKGDLFFFDSNRTHRVTPVTSGIRKTLVFWIMGKNQL